MALMSYASSATHHIPLSLSSYKTIRQRGEDMINRCLYSTPTTRQGGSVVVESCTIHLVPTFHGFLS